MRTATCVLAVTLVLVLLASNVVADTLRFADRKDAGVVLVAQRGPGGDRDRDRDDRRPGADVRHPRGHGAAGFGYRPPYHRPPVYTHPRVHPPVVIMPYPGHPPVVIQPWPSWGTICPYGGSYFYYQGRNFGIWIDF